jgi:hypothetical protein
MKTTALKVEEINFELRDSKNMIFELLDHQINSYKLNYLSEWIANHSACSSEKEQKINLLTTKKEEIEALFSKNNSNEFLVDFNISIRKNPAA